MEKGLIVLMLLVLWGPAVLYLGYRFIRTFNSPASVARDRGAEDEAGSQAVKHQQA